MSEMNAAAMLALLPELPLFVAYVVGLALAASYARSLGNVALMAGIGFALLTLSWLIGAGTQYWMLTMPRDTMRASMALVAALRWLREGATLAGTIFLMIALFAPRGETRAA